MGFGSRKPTSNDPDDDLHDDVSRKLAKAADRSQPRQFRCDCGAWIEFPAVRAARYRLKCDACSLAWFVEADLDEISRADFEKEFIPTQAFLELLDARIEERRTDLAKAEAVANRPPTRADAFGGRELEDDLELVRKFRNRLEELEELRAEIVERWSR